MSALLAPRPTFAPTLRLAPTTDPVSVCFVIDRLSRAGTESQLLALIRTLDRDRVRPSLVLLDGEDDISRALEPADCPVVRLGVRKLRSLTAARAARRLLRAWGEDRPDVVQTYFQDSTYFAIPLAKWAGVKTRLRVRNNLGYALTGRDRRMDRILAPMLTATLTNSAAGRDALLESGTAADKVKVFGNGVDLERFKAYLLPDTSKPRVRIGCVANLRAIKNIDGLMRAAKRLLDVFPHLTFEVAGDGEQRAELESLHADLGLGDRFVLRGSVSDAAAFLRTVDVAVLPSHSEGMSNSLLEYMAAGRAVVATDVGSNAAVLANGRCGLVVPAGDDAALADAVAAFVSNPLKAAGFGAAARKRVEAEYSRPVMVRRFEAYYGELAGA